MGVADIPDRRSVIFPLAITTIFCFLPSPSWSLPPTTDSPPLPPPSVPTPSPTAEGFNIFPAGINVNQRPVIPSILIRGQEDGAEAINFNQWLIPFDAVIQALKLEIQPQTDGQLQIKTQGFVIQLKANTLQQDPELGLAISIQDLKADFGIEAEFDLIKYAIQLQVPWFNTSRSILDPASSPVQVQGLPKRKSPILTLSALEQQTNISSEGQSLTTYQGTLVGVGQILGSSWFARINQSDLTSPKQWTLAETQILRQTPSADYILGSQQPFWPSSGSSGDYFGFTTIQRQKFSPPQQLFGGAPNLQQRFQASHFGRTIEGRAEPGTLVQLRQGFGDQVIAQQLINSTGLYRFETVKLNTEFQFGNYRIFLYPQGRLTATPEIREVTFRPISGQLPKGASAWILSAGLNRQQTLSGNSNLFGTLSDFRGGVAARWGATENLTLGLGAVYENTGRGLGELFFQPQSIPLSLAASVLTGRQGFPLIINSNIDIKPTSKLTLQLSSNEFSERFNLNWQATNNINFSGNLDSQSPPEASLQYSKNGEKYFTSIGASLDLKRQLRWNFFQQLYHFELNSFGNETGIFSRLNYSFLPPQNFSTGHGLFLGYETTTLNRPSSLFSAGWQYRSAPHKTNGNIRWNVVLGYGFASQGTGLIASLQTALIPGMDIRGTYTSVSTTTTESRFRLEITSNLSLQPRFRAGDRNLQFFRTQGGLILQPFFDANQNGKRDKLEKGFTDSNLGLLNNKPFRSFGASVEAEHFTLRLPTGIYRLDLDPAGFPADWAPIQDAYAVEVAAGSYTRILIPFVRSYTVSGVVTNSQGQPLRGARVQAILSSTNQRLFSITNTAGVFYLERLQQGTYSLEINGQLAQPNQITLNESTLSYQELNLQLP